MVSRGFSFKSAPAPADLSSMASPSSWPTEPPQLQVAFLPLREVLGPVGVHSSTTNVCEELNCVHASSLKKTRVAFVPSHDTIVIFLHLLMVYSRTVFEESTARGDRETINPRK
jgi:hypothetical protein